MISNNSFKPSPSPHETAMRSNRGQPLRIIFNVSTSSFLKRVHNDFRFEQNLAMVKFDESLPSLRKISSKFFPLISKNFSKNSFEYSEMKDPRLNFKVRNRGRVTYSKGLIYS